MNRVIKFWTEDREFNLSCMLRSTIFMCQNDLSSPEFQKKADKDGWFKIESGDMIRILTVKPENKICLIKLKI